MSSTSGPRDLLAEVSVNLVVEAVLAFFLVVVLAWTPWPGPSALVMATVLALFLIPIGVLGGATYLTAVRLGIAG